MPRAARVPGRTASTAVLRRRTMTAKPARRSPGWVAASTRQQRTSGWEGQPTWFHGDVAVGHNAGTWARARGWALWKALIGLPGDEELNLRIIHDVIADHRAAD